MTETLKQNFVTVKVEGYGLCRLPSPAPVVAVLQYFPAGYEMHTDRILWRGNDALFDSQEDDYEKILTLNEGDHLVFAPRGSYR